MRSINILSCIMLLSSLFAITWCANELDDEQEEEALCIEQEDDDTAISYLERQCKAYKNEELPQKIRDIAHSNILFMLSIACTPIPKEERS